MSNPPEINVKRRRKGETPTGRAEAPVRREPGSGGSSSSTGGGGGSYQPTGGGGSYPPTGGGFQMPSKGKLGGGCGGFLVVILIIAYLIFGGGLGDLGGDSNVVDYPTLENQPAVNQPQANLPTNTPRPTRVASSGDTGQKWLVMMYQDADDQILEQDIYMDLNEAEKVGSSDRVTIVSQFDRFRGGFQDDGNWTSTRRYLITQDNNLNSVSSEVVQDLGEANMAAGESLADFVSWAVRSYDADRYVLILSDHGMGWPGGWSDPAPGGSDRNNAPLASRLEGDNLYLSELDAALAYLQKNNILDQFDIIGMDACLMSQMEIYAALQPYAEFAVASEETEPGLGWAYAGFLEELVNNPDMSTEQLTKTIVDTYIQQDQRIVDNNARADFLRQGSQMGGFFGAPQVSASQLAQQLSKNITLTAVDLKTYPELINAFNKFLFELQDEDQSMVASAKNYAQSYTSIFGKEVPPSFIDLGHFVQLIARNSTKNAVTQSASNLMDSINQTIVAEKHGTSKPGSTGIAIYFPNSSLYRSPYTGPQSYNVLAERFATTSLWDDFLAFHYNDRSFNETAVNPSTQSQGGISRIPGSGNISISEITKTGDSVAPGDSVTLSANISGQNVGHVYLFSGLFDSQSNSIYVADTDYLESPETQELNGVYYPVWPEGGEFRMNFEWEPLLFSITDGNQSVLALFNPVDYGAAAEDAQYYVDGTYIFADGGEHRRAKMYFKDGKLFQIFGYYGKDDAGAPAEITPTIGDQFTISQKWMDLDSSGSISQVVYEDGDTLTFGLSSFKWEQVYAPAGEYLVGFLVSDMDGNLTQSYTQMTVE